MKEKLKQFIKENYVKEKELFFGSMRKAVYYDYECAGSIDEFINDVEKLYRKKINTIKEDKKILEIVIQIYR